MWWASFLAEVGLPQSEQGTLGSMMAFWLSASAQALVTGDLLLTDSSVPDKWLQQELKRPPGMEQQAC